MKHRTSSSVISCALFVVMTGCATAPAPDFKGRWKAVNRYAETPQEIPLHQSYIFFPSPMDGTLKNMLSRWAKDSKMTLSYLHSSDFTLHGAVTQIHTSNLSDATSQLTSAYAGQGVEIMAENNQIVVRAVPVAGTEPMGGGEPSAP